MMPSECVCAGHAKGKSSSAPAAPLLASAGEHTPKIYEAHGVSRSSPDTPLSDRLKASSYTETLSQSAGSHRAKTGAAASLGSGAARHAGEASCSASGSLSDRSINVCFNSASPGRACRGVQMLSLSAADSSAAHVHSDSQQDSACPAEAAGPILAFKDPRGVSQRESQTIES